MKYRRFLNFFIIIYLSTILSCSPLLGAAWYAKSGSNSHGTPMCITSIKILEKDVDVSDPECRNIAGDKDDIFSKAKRFSITVPHSVKSIDTSLIKIEAWEDSKRKVPIKYSLEIEGDSVPLVSGEAVSILLRIKDKDGKFRDEEKFISIIREEGDDEDNSDPNTPPPSDPQEPELPALENPKDENGEEKFKVKITVKREELDPFDFYKEDANGFSASVFDSWILNITEIAYNNVPSYSFKTGSWEGEPPMCEGPVIGEGQINKTWGLKYYKYKTQEERWKERGGYVSNIDELEKKRRERFIFFKFTGSASGGTKLDNSLFCVDTHTKFLFYYSSPANISSFGVPSNWKDYEEESEGNHVKFDQPFYMSDPIGYVKEDGECVIYTWAQNHIKNNDYTAPFDRNFRKEAKQTPGGKGYSPYRNKKIKTTKERTIKENPNYTAAKPIILMQSGDVYLFVSSPQDAVLSVKVNKMPPDEVLSYQWYKNNVASQEGGEAIDGATTAEHILNKEVMDVYCYCVITNKNTKNSKEAKTASQPVKVRIAESQEQLKIDAETPLIIEHPKSVKHTFTEGKAVEISLAIKVKPTKDNGKISYQWFENTVDSTKDGKKIEGANEATYKFNPSVAGVKYYYCFITNTNDKATGLKEMSVYSATAKVELEKLYQLSVSCIGKGSLEVIGANSGGVIVNEDSTMQLDVRAGTKLFFLSVPKQGWEIEKWEGDIETLGDIRTAEIFLKNKEVIDKGVTITFRKIPKKGLLSVNSILIENLSLSGKMWGRSYDFTYFDWDMKIGIEDDKGDESTPIWKNQKIRFMKKDAGASAYVMPIENAKDLEVLLENKKGTANLNTYLHKKDSSELGGIYDNEFNICEHEKNIIQLGYNEITDSWHVKDGEFNEIQMVTLEFDKNFTLRRGQKKVFSVTYRVNNPKKNATGSVKISYTLSWE